MPGTKRAAESYKKIEELLAGTAGTKNSGLNMELINQAGAALWFPEGISEEEKLKRMVSVIALLKGIKPENEIEGLLATQMIATHHAAMECMRRAMIQNQTFEGRDQNLKHATKLSGLFVQQMDALNKNRGKGQQRVTVEHIRVEAGAQAVVGNVHAASRSDAPPPSTKAALTHAPGKTLEMKPKAPAPVSRRSK